VAAYDNVLPFGKCPKGKNKPHKIPVFPGKFCLLLYVSLPYECRGLQLNSNSVSLTVTFVALQEGVESVPISI
jgi:hypothetical protein